MNLIDDKPDLFRHQLSWMNFLACFDLKRENIPDKYWCGKCKTRLRGLHYAFEFVKHPTFEYRYFPYENGYYCQFCMAFHEMVYIRRGPYEKLPLLINHMWITPEADNFYKDRLTGLTDCEMDNRIRRIMR